MPQPLLTLGGAEGAPVMHLAPANGFVPQTYLPMLRPFFASYRVLSLPPRALWGDGAPPPMLGAPDWRQVTDDLLAGLAHYELPPVVAVGHSFGGVASALAVIRQPQRFRALVLLDPTFLPEHVLQGILQLKQMGIPEQHPLAQAALKRKRDFDSPDELYLRYRTRPTFADWTEEALRLYAEHGTTPKPDGGVTLAWSPEWEAFYFSSGYTETWEELPALNGNVPTLVIQGATSDTFTPESYERAQTLLPNATFKQVAGHGHLFPHSAPDQASALIREWLDKVLVT